MTYYDALIAKWPTLGAAVIDQGRIDAAKKAFAAPLAELPVRNADEELRDFEARLDAANAERDAWRAAWIDIFEDAAVVAKCEKLNAMTVTGDPLAEVPIEAVMGYLRANGLWLPIKAAQATSQGAAAAVDLNDDLRARTINFSLPVVKAMVADLIGHGLLRSEHLAAMTMLEVPEVPWWQSAGYSGPITPADLEAVFIDTRTQTVLV